MSKIILVRGKAGTGKTTLSKEIGKKLNIMVLHKDDIYDTVSTFISEHANRNKICFEILYKILTTSLECGVDIVIDYGYNNLEDVKKLKTWILQRNGELKSILCTCEDKVWAERLNRRKLNPLPNQLLTDIHALQKHYSKMPTGVLVNELVIDSTLEIDHLVKQVVNYITKK